MVIIGVMKLKLRIETFREDFVKQPEPALSCSGLFFQQQGCQQAADKDNKHHRIAELISRIELRKSFDHGPPDQRMIEQARTDAAKSAGEATKGAKAYEDYRKLLDDAATLDAVLIGTPDHWHAPLCTAFMKAGKHVYCEKPLTHSVAEARELRELSRTAMVVTQMGNQGSASASLRRASSP